jgi:hypothetical protein
MLYVLRMFAGVTCQQGVLRFRPGQPLVEPPRFPAMVPLGITCLGHMVAHSW